MSDSLPARTRVEHVRIRLKLGWRTSDKKGMNSHLRALKQLIDDGMYIVDERSVAAAVVARASVSAAVANVSFRTELRAPVVRSFRRDPHARSFRLERTPRLHG